MWYGAAVLCLIVLENTRKRAYRRNNTLYPSQGYLMAFPSSKKKGKGLLSSGDVGLFVLGKACGIFHPNTSLSVCMIACTFMQLLNIPNSETRSTHIGIRICALECDWNNCNTNNWKRRFSIYKATEMPH